jgi:hypothetical protein
MGAKRSDAPLDWQLSVLSAMCEGDAELKIRIDVVALALPHAKAGVRQTFGAYDETHPKSMASPMQPTEMSTRAPSTSDVSRSACLSHRLRGGHRANDHGCRWSTCESAARGHTTSSYCRSRA